jgi:hypothetical protein
MLTWRDVVVFIHTVRSVQWVVVQYCTGRRQRHIDMNKNLYSFDREHCPGRKKKFFENYFFCVDMYRVST